MAMRPAENQDPEARASLRLRIRRGELPRQREDAEAARLSREPDEIFAPIDPPPPGVEEAPVDRR